MVPEQEVDPAAGGLGLAFEPAKEIERLARVAAPIDDVAKLDQVRGASDPGAWPESGPGTGAGMFLRPLPA